MDLLDVIYQSEEIFHLYNNSVSIHLIAASIIQVAFIVLTQQTGMFPITYRLSLLIKADPALILIHAKKILKFVLQKDIYQNLDL